MSPREVFVDTSALMAIVSRNDALYLKASDWYRRLVESKVVLVTSDWVLAEFLGSASRAEVRRSSATLVHRFQASNRTLVLEASREFWMRTFEFYVQHHDKQWSFVDCSSMLICRDRSITRVFTHDRDFEQFGLECLLRDQGRRDPS